MSYRSKRWLRKFDTILYMLLKVFIFIALVFGIVFCVVATSSLSIAFISAIQGDVPWH